MQTQQRQKIPILQNQVVVFSKNYLPLARINIKRAVILLVTGQAESLDFSSTQQWEIRSPSLVLQVPEHIRLTSGNPERHWKVPPVSRRAWDNVVAACERCNSRKGDRLLHETGMMLRTKPKAPMHPALAKLSEGIAFADQFWKEQQTNDY